MKSGSVLSPQSSSLPLRILHVIGWLDFGDGGPPMVATRLAAAQARLGHDVSIAFYSSGRTIDQQTDRQLAALPNWDRIKVHRFPPCSRLERLLGKSAERQLEPLIAQADVIHLHNVWEGILLQAAAAARAAGKPYLIVVNGMLDPWALSQKAWKKRFALAVTHRRMLNRCNMLHLLNEDERSLIEPLRITAPSTIIPNGVTLEEIDPLPPRGQFLAGRPELGPARGSRQSRLNRHDAWPKNPPKTTSSISSHTYTMSELLPYGQMAEKHWREHCPRLVKDLEAENRLQVALEEAQTRTAKDMDRVMTNGPMRPQLTATRKAASSACWAKPNWR